MQKGNRYTGATVKLNRAFAIANCQKGDQTSMASKAQHHEPSPAQERLIIAAATQLQMVRCRR
jgi:hypothetical protein